MKRVLAALACTLVLASSAQALFGPEGESVEKKREAVRKDRNEIVAKVAATNPEVKEKIKKAEGYATFNNKNVYLFMLATGHGYGVVVNNKTGKETFMRMGSVGGGVGMGARDLRVLLIFHSQDAMKRFIEEGMQVGSEAGAAAKAGETGGAGQQTAGVDTGGSMIETYQIVETGVAAQATVSGVKYWKDTDLN
jgi:lipid-binding SYLF domain-containing protein